METTSIRSLARSNQERVAVAISDVVDLNFETHAYLHVISFTRCPCRFRELK